VVVGPMVAVTKSAVAKAAAMPRRRVFATAPAAVMVVICEDVRCRRESCRGASPGWVKTDFPAYAKAAAERGWAQCCTGAPGPM
jgi:hypothetical protein